MLRVLALLVVLPLLLCLLGAAHAYLALRLAIEPLDGAAEAIGVALIGALGALVLLQPLAERRLRPAAVRWIAWPASLWMGAAFWLLLLLPLFDLAVWLGTPAASAASAAEVGPNGSPFAAWRAALALGLTGAGLVAGLRSGLAPPRCVSQRFEIEGWPEALDGFRIAQISDVHIGPILGHRFADHLVERIQALRPDLIAITGDLVDGSAARLADEVEPFGRLAAPWGVYFVTGNHDHYSGASAWAERLRELGLRVLRNERVEVGPPGARFDLVGVDDHHAHFAGDGREDLAAALAGRDASRPAVLLAHDPASFAAARGQGIDLQLSGHTHGGQLWPFGWFVRLATPWVAGRYRDGRAQLYVSRGTGFWGPPLRLGSPAEITEITLHAAH